jgi:hypothetical protein
LTDGSGPIPHPGALADGSRGTAGHAADPSGTAANRDLRVVPADDGDGKAQAVPTRTLPRPSVLASPGKADTTDGTSVASLTTEQLTGARAGVCPAVPRTS